MASWTRRVGMVSLALAMISAGGAARAEPPAAEPRPQPQPAEAPAQVATPPLDPLLTTLRAAMPDVTVEWVRPGPAGLHTLKLGPVIVYLDPTGRYLISGAVFDLLDQRNLTAEVLGQEAAARVFTDRLPALAIPLGDARTPEQELVVFDDVDCPYCQREHPELLALAADGWRVWVLLYPVASLHPHATSKSIAVWCAPDRAAALRALWETGQRPPDRVCPTPLEEIQALARIVPVTGTPTMILRNGVIRRGYQSAAALRQLATGASRAPMTPASDAAPASSRSEAVP